MAGTSEKWRGCGVARLRPVRINKAGKLRRPDACYDSARKQRALENPSRYHFLHIFVLNCNFNSTICTFIKFKFFNLWRKIYRAPIISAHRVHV